MKTHRAGNKWIIARKVSVRSRNMNERQCSETLYFVAMRRLGSLFLCIQFATLLIAIASETNDGVLDKIKAGLQHASNYLETAKDIADLVSKSLGHRQKGEQGDNKEDANTKQKAEQTFGTSNIVSAFLRLLGLDSPKIAAIAVNSVIFLAQMISSLFELKLPAENLGRNLDEEDQGVSWNPMKFILETRNERIQNLVKQAQDHELPNQLIDRVDGLDSACIRLLLCKTSTVIRAAQNSLKNKSRGGFDCMTAWLPSKREFETNSDECEDRHVDCNLFPE